MPRSYSMRGVLGAADRATALARTVLRHLHPGAHLHEVQADPRFQHRGVDLLCERADGQVLGVEVKGDRQGRRGNYFFELVSNLEKDTPGCFLYSEADLYAYVLLAEREVHLMPLREARAWFLERAKDFPLRDTRTRMGNEHYTTVGALVPISLLLRELPSIQTFRVTPDGQAEANARGRRRRARAVTPDGATGRRGGRESDR